MADVKVKALRSVKVIEGEDHVWKVPGDVFSLSSSVEAKALAKGGFVELISAPAPAAAADDGGNGQGGAKK